MKKLGFGCMRLPLVNAEDMKSVDIKQMCQMVDIFLERGFTYFDTAYMYHRYSGESFVNKTLVKRHSRDKFTLATKMPIQLLKTEDDMERIFGEQLEKCNVEYFDYYLLHNLNEAYYDIAKNLDSFSFIQKKKEEGKIRNIGFSYHDDAVLLDQILTEHPEVGFVQLQLNYLDWESSDIQSKKCYEVCIKHEKPVVVMEPIKGGLLAVIPENANKIMKAYAPERSIASWAIRYVASLSNVMMVLSGMSSLEQMLDNTSYMEDFVPLNKSELDIINQVKEIIIAETSKVTTIPCTGCQYCVEGCPKNIRIPKYFSLYNSQKRYGARSMSIMHYVNSIAKYGKAMDCISCGQCELVCPQNLPIIEYMKNVSGEFDSILQSASVKSSND